MEKFEATPLSWTRIPEGKSPSDHMKNLENVKSKEIRNCLCRLENGCGLIFRRIGSPSISGEVYSLKIKDSEIAAKVMPIVDDKSEQKNRKEADIALFVANAVLDGKVSHFLVSYGYLHCDSIQFRTDSQFYNEAKIYAFVKAVSSRLEKSSSKRFKYMTRNVSLENIKALARDYIEDIPEESIDYDISSDILLSELLWGDVRSYLEERNPSDSDWNIIIDQILVCLKELEILGINHNDLHLGNLLIRDISKLELVIHDFGKSEEGVPNGEDYTVVLDALLRHNPPPKIRNRIETLLSNP